MRLQVEQPEFEHSKEPNRPRSYDHDIRFVLTAWVGDDCCHFTTIFGIRKLMQTYM